MPGVKYAVSVPWTEAERTTLRQMHENGMGPTRIGQMLGRSTYATAKQLKVLKLRRHPVPDMTPRPADKPRPPQPLRPGAHTLPPLPSEMGHD